MDKMEFDYDIYLRQNCLVCLGLLLFCMVMLTVFIMGYVRYFRNDTTERSFGVIAEMILILVVLLFMMSINFMPLLRGGIYLLSEKENDAIEVTGEIESTFELSFIGGMKYSDYGIMQNRGSGEGIVIEGTKYYLMTYGDFKEGDKVTIKVLPKSKLVLELSSASY